MSATIHLTKPSESMAWQAQRLMEMACNSLRSGLKANKVAVLSEIGFSFGVHRK